MRGRVAASTPAQAPSAIAQMATARSTPPSDSSSAGTSTVARKTSATVPPMAIATPGMRDRCASMCSSNSRANQIPHSAATASPDRNSATDTRSASSMVASASQPRPPSASASTTAKTRDSRLALLASSAAACRVRQPNVSVSWG